MGKNINKKKLSITGFFLEAPFLGKFFLEAPYLGKFFFNGTWAWTPWKILLGAPPSSPLEGPTYYQRAKVPTYLPTNLHA